MYYKEVNVNPKKKRTGDCVIRAIANAEGIDWYDLYDELCRGARELASVPVWKETYEYYLYRYPTVSAKYVDANGKTKRLRPRDFKAHGLTGTYVVRLAHHLTCVRDGVVEDIWDCSDKSAYKIWKIK